MIDTILIKEKNMLEEEKQGFSRVDKTGDDQITTTTVVYNGSPFSNLSVSAPWYTTHTPFSPLIYSDSHGEINCGVVSLFNPYLVTRGAKVATLDKTVTYGKGEAKTHFNKSQTLANGELFDFYSTVLPNCVGWAGSRIRELYYLYKGEDLSGMECDLYSPSAWVNHLPNTLIPGTDKKQWRKLELTESPIPGCVAIYKSTSFSHIAFVEAVYNAGTDGEYAIISQSSYSEDKTHTTVKDPPVTVDLVRKKNLWKYYQNCRFDYFIRTPICDLVDSEGWLNVNIKVNENNITEEDLVKLREQELIAKNELKTGDWVEVQWLGNETWTGIGKNINKIGVKGWVSAVYSGSQYPYEVKNDVLVGYFDRTGLKKWN